MLNDEDLDERKAKRICHVCVGETYLSAEIARDGDKGPCSYCEEDKKSFTIADMAERIDAAFSSHYVRTYDQPTSWQQSLMSDRESDYEWERDGEPVLWAIAGAAEIPEEAAQDILDILEDQYGDIDAQQAGEESDYDSESHYEERGVDDRQWQDSWRDFEKSLRTEARFFSRGAEEHLASVFADIDKLTTRDGRPLVANAGPGTAFPSLYRARVFQSDGKLEHALTQLDRQLGSPPSAGALAGRMNARGISVFYGANDPLVALAEIRPPVGSQVLVGRFDIVRPLRLLDLTALSNVRVDGSIFDPKYSGALERAMFLSSLSGRITKPVMPDDEAFDYLSTQAIADFLATTFTPALEGIVYPSVQAQGTALNIVLFHKAARVAPFEYPAGTEITASLGQNGEDGWETEYRIMERTPKPKPVADDAAKNAWPPDLRSLIRPPIDWNPDNIDAREPALALDIDSVAVHRVASVTFDAPPQRVSHFRWEKRDHGI
jgi:hypothetical protein